MLEKVYSAVGATPAYSRHNRELHINRETGVPTTEMWRFKDRPEFKAQHFTMRHGLDGNINYYAVTRYNYGLLFMISNGYSTRYHLELDTQKKQMITIGKGCRGMKRGWRNLFMGLLFDDRPAASALYKALVEFFKEAFDYTHTNDGGLYFHRTRAGLSIHVSVHGGVPRGYVEVLFSKPGQVAFKKLMPIDKHLGKELGII